MNITIQNGWMLSVLFLVVGYLPMFFSKKGTKRLTSFKWMSKRGKNLSFIIWILFLLTLIIPIFHSITTQPTQLIIGAILTLLGIVGLLISYHNYFTSESDKLITKGIYKLSRNPIYVFTLLIAAGIGVLCSIYEMIPVILLYFIVQHPIIKEEEQFCQETYGEAYKAYKQKVRRYI